MACDEVKPFIHGDLECRRKVCVIDVAGKCNAATLQAIARGPEVLRSKGGTCVEERAVVLLRSEPQPRLDGGWLAYERRGLGNDDAPSLRASLEGNGVRGAVTCAFSAYRCRVTTSGRAAPLAELVAGLGDISGALYRARGADPCAASGAADVGAIL